MKTLSLPALLLATLPLTTLDAHAANILTDRTAFDTATGGAAALETFDTHVPKSMVINFASGFTSTFVGTHPAGQPNQGVSGGSFRGAVSQVSDPSPYSIRFDFTNPVNSFFGDFSRLVESRQLSVQGDFDGTGLQTVNLVATLMSSAGGFGLIGAASFTSIEFVAVGLVDSEAAFFLDNFAFGIADVDRAQPPGTVPLPAPLALLLGGLGSLVVMRVRRRAA